MELEKIGLKGLWENIKVEQILVLEGKLELSKEGPEENIHAQYRDYARNNS